jgi:hypothetical protein
VWEEWDWEGKELDQDMEGLSLAWEEKVAGEQDQVQVERETVAQVQVAGMVREGEELAAVGAQEMEAGARAAMEVVVQVAVRGAQVREVGKEVEVERAMVAAVGQERAGTAGAGDTEGEGVMAKEEVRED